jgi:murein peptide amidase A
MPTPKTTASTRRLEVPIKNIMRATQPPHLISSPLNAKALSTQFNPTRRLLQPLLDLSENSDYLTGGSVGEILDDQDVFQIPRFIFMGPTGGGDTIRLGIFAGLHDDDREGAEALAAFLEELEVAPQTARGCHLYAYPICNPTRFAAHPQSPTGGEDLAGQFWNGSLRPEVYYLEREMGVLHFHGVISLHGNNQSEGFTVDTKSTVLNRALAQPALQATQRFLAGNPPGRKSPLDLAKTPSVAPLPNFLTATDELKPAPFELHVGIPKSAPKPSQIHGTVGALKSILDSYRSFLSIGQNL